MGAVGAFCVPTARERFLVTRDRHPGDLGSAPHPVGESSPVRYASHAAVLGPPKLAMLERSHEPMNRRLPNRPVGHVLDICAVSVDVSVSRSDFFTALGIGATSFLVPTRVIGTPKEPGELPTKRVVYDLRDVPLDKSGQTPLPLSLSLDRRTRYRLEIQMPARTKVFGLGTPVSPELVAVLSLGDPPQNAGPFDLAVFNTDAVYAPIDLPMGDLTLELETGLERSGLFLVLMANGPLLTCEELGAELRRRGAFAPMPDGDDG